MQCATCDPNDDCTCDQEEHTTLNKYGYHLLDGGDLRGYWYAYKLTVGNPYYEGRAILDYDTAMAKRALREYGYK